MADSDDDAQRTLQDLYGTVNPSPRLDALDNAIYGAPPPQLDSEVFDTRNVLRRMPEPPTGVSAWLQNLAGRIRADSRPDNALAGGMDTAARWLNLDPHIGPDTVAPLGAAAMGTMGLGVLGRPDNSVGIFGGRLAATADREALSRAEEMAGRGADRREIWDQTGWFQGVDGRWRFEMPDNMSMIPNPTLEAVMTRGGTAGSAFRAGLNHPHLFEAYPDMRRIDWIYTRDNNPSGSFGQGRLGAPDYIGARGPDAETLRSVALHESQHGIQRREHFATGANMESVATPLYDRINQRLSAIAREMDTAAPAQREALRAQYDALLDERSAINARDLYHRTAGEVEARNVQRRMHMTPEERRNRPPWETQDVADSRQILRDHYGEGPAMSARSEIAQQIADWRNEGIFLRAGDEVSETVLPQAMFSSGDIRASQLHVDARSFRYWQRQIQGGARPAVLLEETAPGRYRIVDGHTRATAYARLGIEDVPVVVRRRPR